MLMTVQTSMAVSPATTVTLPGDRVESIRVVIAAFTSQPANKVVIAVIYILSNIDNI